jgi:adenosylcobyric acid synthase
MSARALFVGGTSSHAGKSWMVTAICASLRRRGVSVAPFKAQNMSNNSFPCAAGGEIGRAQVAQAEACGLAPEPAMNPVLLKPNGDGTSQVVVNGRVWKTLSARDYYLHAHQLRDVVAGAYEHLAARFDVIVIEGAGSVTELNLRAHDIVNLDLVTRVRAPWMLVADIERGGVFASVIGTTQLLTPEERSLFRGFAINRFRGDASLFADGVVMLEERTGAACLGVFPYADDLMLDAEDSVSIGQGHRPPAPPGARVAIVRLPCISNTTDFRLLPWADWISSPPAADYDVVILPGSKSTIADLEWLHATGLSDWIVAQHRRGVRVVGICGGFQMLGRTVRDPDAVESARTFVRGLGLVPADTILRAEKTTRVVRATSSNGETFGAYEIHLGQTLLDSDGSFTPFARLDAGTADGIVMPGIVGTYLHGALEHPAVCEEMIGVRLPAAVATAKPYERLADWFDAHVRHREVLGLD